MVQSRAPVAYEDAAANEELAESDVLLALGHRAYLGVPLAGREGALHGVLSVYSLQPRSWREDEIQALVALAANASVALSNAELYQRVAVEREQSVAILANIADGIVAVDREGNVVLWNRAAEEITGVPAAEAVGRTPAQVLQRDLAVGRRRHEPRGRDRERRPRGLAVAVRGRDARSRPARSPAASSRSATSRPSTRSSR